MKNVTWSLALAALGLSLSLNAQADYCIAVNGGWGNGGATFIGTNFTSPAAGVCKSWSGMMKTATTVVGTSIGAACLSDDGKLLTLTLHTTDPEFFGAGTVISDHIELCPLNSTLGCPANGGQFDHGSYFSGPALKKACTAADSTIPSSHN